MCYVLLIDYIAIRESRECDLSDTSIAYKILLIFFSSIRSNRIILISFPFLINKPTPFVISEG